jgi:transcriptional regulator with XRE-family HTH domain
MSDDVSSCLAENVRALREARGMTQQRIAALAGVPRATWAHLETGAGNPTLSVLVKVASALQVTVEELIGPPRASAKLFLADELPVKRRGNVVIRRLLPDPIPGMEMERMELPPGAAFAGVPHTAGTREYLTCEVGELELSASGQRWRLSAGDVVVFRGDQKHGYRNPSRRKAVAYSVVALAPGVG